MKQPGRIWRLILIMVCASVVPSCMITRLRQVKSHLCEFENNFYYDSNNGFLLTFKMPTLYDKDIITLAGSGPSEVYLAEERKISRYIFIRRNYHEASKITLVHEYVKDGGKFKLQRYQIDSNLSRIVTEKLITHALKSGCNLKISRQKVILEFGDEVEKYLPDKVLIRQILGEPDEHKNGSFVYYYYLLNSASKYEYRVEIVFDEQNGVVAAMDLEYLLYRVEIDFKNRIAVAGVKDYLDFIRLSLNVGLSP